MMPMFVNTSLVFHCSKFQTIISISASCTTTASCPTTCTPSGRRSGRCPSRRWPPPKAKCPPSTRTTQKNFCVKTFLRLPSSFKPAWWWTDTLSLIRSWQKSWPERLPWLPARTIPTTSRFFTTWWRNSTPIWGFPVDLFRTNRFLRRHGPTASNVKNVILR